MLAYLFCSVKIVELQKKKKKSLRVCSLLKCVGLVWIIGGGGGGVCQAQTSLALFEQKQKKTCPVQSGPLNCSDDRYISYYKIC